MAEILGGNERKDLYRKMLNDAATAESTRKYSLKDFEKRILGDEQLLGRISDLSIKKGWAIDEDDFINRYAPEFKAPPAPKQQAAPTEEGGDYPKLNAFNQYGQRDLFLKEIQKTPQDQIKEAEEKNWALYPYANDDIDKQIEEWGVEEVLKNIPLKEKDPRRQKKQTPSAPAKEQETYIPPPQPAVGSPEYDKKLQAQYGGMSPTLGATFAGAPASFETEEQKKQEQISPVFKAQKLAYQDVPIAEEQRRAQREFAKAPKEQQQAALIGSTGAELKKARQAEREGPGDRASANVEALWEGAKNAGINIFNGLKAVMNNAALNETPMDEGEREYYQQEQWGEMYRASKEAGENLQNELYRLNVSPDVLNAIDKGDYGKIPEATLQTIGNVGISAISSLLTAGGSMYFQTLPDTYREGVEAIAREKGITPEEVIRSGEDAKITAQTTAGIIAALERAGAGRLSKSIANKGGYKAVRDFLIRNGFSKPVGRLGGLGYAGSGEFATEYAQQGAQQLGRIVAASEDASQFYQKLPKEFLSKEAFKERLGAGVAGFVGGAGVVGIGRGSARTFGPGVSLDKFSDNIANNEIIQNAARGYEDNISRAEEQGRKPEAYNQKQLKKILNDPEAWVKEEIKYLKQTIESNKNLGLDSKVEENSMAKATSLLNQIKAEKKAIEEADIASAQTPAAPQEEAQAVPAEEVQGTGRRIVVDSIEQVPAEYRDKVIEVTAGPLGRFGIGKKQYVYIVPTETVDVTAPQVETVNPPPPSPIAPEAPAAPVATPVSREEMDANIEAGQKRAGFVFQSPLDSLSQEAKSIISNVQRNKYIATAPVKQLFDELYNAYKIYANQRQATSRNLTTSQIEEGIADFENALEVLGEYISKRDSGKFVRDYTNRSAQEVAPVEELPSVTEEVPFEEVSPVMEETPVAPEEEEDLLAAFRAAPEEEANLLAAFRAAPEEEVVTEEEAVPAEEVAPEPAPVAPVEEAAPVAPAAPAPKGRKKKATPVKPAPAVAETKFKPNPNATYYISKGADEVFYTLREIAGDDLDVHVMNLSKDLADSKQKAKELIGEDVEFDEASLGRDYKKIRANKTGKGQKLAQRQEGEGAGMNTLSFGKYNGKTIDEVFEIDKPYILYLNKEYSNNTVFQKGVRDNPKIKEFIEQSLADKEQQRKNLENLTEIGGVKFDDKGVAKAIPIKGKIKYINNRMGPQGMYKVYILDTEYGIPVEVSGDIAKFADGNLEQGAELSFTANVQKSGDKFKVIGRKSEYTKPAETKEGKKAEAKEERKETSFKGIASFETAKGSVYTVLPDGRTQRFKTATKEQNEPQDLTVFVKFKDAAQEQDFLEGVQRSETSGTKVYVIDKQGNKYDTNEQAAGKDVRLALVKDGKVIDTAETSTTPKIGYNTFDQRRFEKDGEKYRQAHLGNKVVKINEQTKTEAAPAEFTSQQESSASQEFDGMKKPSKIKTKSFDGKHGKGAFERMKNITDNFDDIMDGMSDKIKQDCL